MKKHVTSLELSKKLKELGVPQTAFWSWYETTDRDDTPRLNRSDENCNVCTLPTQSFEEKYSAYLASELGEMLQKAQVKMKVSPNEMPYFQLVMNEDEFTAEYYISDRNWDGHLIKDFQAKTEVDTRAKMLIYLIENSLLKPEDLV